MDLPIWRPSGTPRLGPVLIGLMTCLCVIGVAAARDTGSVRTNRQTDPQPRRLSAHLYFADKTGRFLTAEERTLTHPGTVESFGTRIVQALIDGSERGLMRTVPAESGLRALYVSKNGTAFVDMSREIRTEHRGGVQMERLTIYAIVNSLILNISDIKTVKILIDGRESPTLAGHMDLRFPFKAKMLLIR